MEIVITIDWKGYTLVALILSAALVFTLNATVADHAKTRAALAYSCPCETNRGVCVATTSIQALSAVAPWNGTRPGPSVNPAIIFGEANQTRALKLVC